MARAYKQVFKLFQQFGDEQTFFRVIGVQKAQPQVFLKGDPSEDYDIYLNFDVLSHDLDHLKEKFVAIAQIVQTLDRNGQTDYSTLLQLALSAIDPVIGEQIILPKDTATEKNVNDMHDLLAQTATGVVKDLPTGMPPQLAMQTIQTYIQSPDVRQWFYNKDDPRTQRMDRLIKQVHFALAQQQNAVIGKIGTPPAPPPQ